MRAGRTRLAFACLAALSCGSSGQRTMLVVELRTNLAVPAELDGVTLDVTTAGDAGHHFAFPLGAGQYTLPFRVGLLAPDGQTSAELTVVAAGQKGSTTVVQEQAVVAFLPGQSRVLTL